MMSIRLPQGPALILRLLAVLWLAVMAILVVFSPSALNLATVSTILQFSTILALVALGQSLVVLAGGAGIDLSVGGAVSLSAVVALLALQFGLPAYLLPPVCILCGLLLGACNGILVTRLAILPLIATLGTLFIYSGMAVAVTGGASRSGVPDWLTAWGREVILGGIPVPFLTITLPAFAVAILVLSTTAWGRWIYAMGFNERSARLVGIPVDRTRLLLYAASGGLAGAAALVSIAWLGSARPNIGQNLELESLTAAMLGGISITGGRGGVGGVLAAVILLITLKTVLLQLNVNTVWQVGIVGALLVVVLLAERLAHHRR